MQPRRHTPNRKNAATRQRQTPRRCSIVVASAEKVSIVCGFLFTLLVRDRTPENNIIMTVRAEEKE